MKRSTAFATAVLAAFALSAGPALAGHGHDEEHHGKKRDSCKSMHVMLEKSDELGLSEEQKGKITDLTWECFEKRVDLKAAIKKAKLKAKKLHMTGAASDEVGSAIRDLYAKKADKKVALLKLSRKARAVLDEDQQKKMREMCPHAGAKHHGKKKAEGYSGKECKKGD